MTINEALILQKSLRERHTELVSLRNDNAHRERRYLGAHADKETVKEPVYDVKKLDGLVTRVAAEMRKLDTALKVTNASTQVSSFTHDESVFGQVE